VESSARYLVFPGELRGARRALRVEHLAEVLGSDATRQWVRATLRSALSDAMRQGLVTVNVAALVKLPAGKRPKALVWTTERESRWREAVAAHVNSGKSTTEARELAPGPPAVMIWRPDQLGMFLDIATGDRLYALFHVIAYRGPFGRSSVGVCVGDRNGDRPLAAATQPIAGPSGPDVEPSAVCPVPGVGFPVAAAGVFR
jgi:hypothetical protein